MDPSVESAHTGGPGSEGSASPPIRADPDPKDPPVRPYGRTRIRRIRQSARMGGPDPGRDPPSMVWARPYGRIRTRRAPPALRVPESTHTGGPDPKDPPVHTYGRGVG